MSVVTQVWNYAAKSCILFLHIVKSESPSDDICVSHICFVFQCRHLAITKCSPQTQYRSGHNHSVAWVCQFARLCVLRSKSCICLKCVDTSFFIAQEMLCIEVTFPTCFVPAKQNCTELCFGISHGWTQLVCTKYFLSTDRTAHQKSTSLINNCVQVLGGSCTYSK